MGIIATTLLYVKTLVILWFLIYISNLFLQCDNKIKKIKLKKIKLLLVFPAKKHFFFALEQGMTRKA